MEPHNLTGVVNIPKACLWFSLLSLSVLVNVAVYFGLATCTLSAATRILMSAQLFSNCIGFTGAFPLIKVILTGTHFSSNPIINGLPCAVVTFAMYTQMALLAFMAANRYVAACHQHKCDYWFSKSRAHIYCIISCCYGTLHFLQSLFPCCQIVFDPVYHRGTFVGQGKWIREGTTLANDFIILPIVIVCYSLAFRRMRVMRNSMTQQERKAACYRREKNLLKQFLIVTGAWFIYLLLYRSQYFFPSLTHIRIWVSLSEIVRIALLMIDPVVYFCFLRQLRNSVIRRMKCPFSVGVTQVSIPSSGPRINNFV